MIKKIYILNGPNLNLLGTREPEKYGKISLEDIKSLCNEKCVSNELDLHFFQSNFEGELIEEIHEANINACGIIINAGALTHMPRRAPAARWCPSALVAVERRRCCCCCCCCSVSCSYGVLTGKEESEPWPNASPQAMTS